MYYLFLRANSEGAERYMAEFRRVREGIENGITPVHSEVRSAKSCLIESVPFNAISGVFMVLAALAVDSIAINEIVKVAVVLIVNSFCYQVANFIFVHLKHRLRLRLCARLGIEPTERNIAVMESLEYQSV